MTDVTFTHKEQSLQEESTTYWFQVDNCHYLTDSDETIGVVEGRNPGLVFDNGEPIPAGDLQDHLARHCAVTDEMRSL